MVHNAKRTKEKCSMHLSRYKHRTWGVSYSCLIRGDEQRDISVCVDSIRQQYSTTSFFYDLVPGLRKDVMGLQFRCPYWCSHFSRQVLLSKPSKKIKVLASCSCEPDSCWMAVAPKLHHRFQDCRSQTVFVSDDGQQSMFLFRFWLGGLLWLLLTETLNHDH